MSEGLLIISYMNDTMEYRLDCGIVTSVNDDITSSVLVTPIVTYSADNAFAFDTGTKEVISFTIRRRDPDVPEDPLGSFNSANITDIAWEHTDRWSNGLWKLALESLIDRWQMRTDGCTVSFTPVVMTDGQPVYQNPINVNAYISSLSIQYSVNSFDTLTVNMTVMVGTMGTTG